MKLKLTVEVLGKITNKIVNDPTNTRTGITYGEALVSRKQMEWLSKVYKMETGKNILSDRCVCFQINGLNYSYGIPIKPCNQYGNYIIEVFPKTGDAYDLLRNKLATM